MGQEQSKGKELLEQTQKQGRRSSQSSGDVAEDSTNTVTADNVDDVRQVSSRGPEEDESDPILRALHNVPIFVPSNKRSGFDHTWMKSRPIVLKKAQGLESDHVAAIVAELQYHNAKQLRQILSNQNELQRLYSLLRAACLNTAAIATDILDHTATIKSQTVPIIRLTSRIEQMHGKVEALKRNLKDLDDRLAVMEFESETMGSKTSVS
eukprot:Clim_evm173s157 gene=Clim_evmTU173s157